MQTKLQEFRKAAGFKSAKAFAEHLGMNPRTYTNYEQGRSGMDIELLWSFADFFGCTVDELIGRSVPTPSMADPIQRAIADAYEQMNEQGRSRLAEHAEMMAKSGMFAKSEDHRVSKIA